jgi:hypothetical protein
MKRLILSLMHTYMVDYWSVIYEWAIAPLTSKLEFALLIARLMKSMQNDLADAESQFVGAGLAASAQRRFGAAMEWAMIGTAYGVEAKTNQIAMASFLGGEGAS